jgi:hypothetical protein
MLQEFLVTIISSAAVSSVLAGLLIWLTKSWISERLKNAIKNEYDEKLESHKSKLKAQTDVEIEKLKSSLSITAAKQGIKFSTLHKDRADVIANTYDLLKGVYLTLQDYVKIFEPAGDKPRDQRREIAVEAHSVFRDYYPKKLIYLPKSTADKLEAINGELVLTFNQFSFNVDFQQGAGDAEKWNEIFKNMNGEMQETLKELEDEFRKLLGDES